MDSDGDRSGGILRTWGAAVRRPYEEKPKGTFSRVDCKPARNYSRYVDQNTLTLTVPDASTGPQDIVLTEATVRVTRWKTQSSFSSLAETDHIHAHFVAKLFYDLAALSQSTLTGTPFTGS